MMASHVLDASALLCALLGETGSERVEALLPSCCISAVNLAEVVAKLAERGVPDEEIRLSLDALDLDVVPFDRDQAMRSGLMHPQTKAAGLSLGDRCCLALAESLGASALTADRNWASPTVGPPIEVCR